MPGPIKQSHILSSVACISILLFTGLFFSFQQKKGRADESKYPKVLDNRLVLTLFAENPDIVTPIGIAVDSLDRIFVLESHTHQRPSSYAGPASDQIKVFIDANGDGKPDRNLIYADGLKEGVNIAFSPEGQLYVVTSRTVWALYDRDGNGISDERKKIVELAEPASVYAHAALLGITFSPDGWMYVSRGNTSGAAWKMVGTDGSSLSGYGDGGNIVRARPDGSELEEVATGFWNPVDLKFSDRGHLLAVDNDPDSRGPNRLVHVVPGGDYGYKSLFGGSGINPYLAWNGELPGTLPFAVGLGEAPSGLLNASHTSLPPEYKGQMLASIWEESSVVRINLIPKGASLTGAPEVLVEGGSDFRPVAFAADSKGNVYFTDWVLRNYPNHGKGKIWKLATRPGVPSLTPRHPYAAFDPGTGTLKALHVDHPSADFDFLVTQLQSNDPFIRQAAVMALGRPQFAQPLLKAANHTDPMVRLGVLLAFKKAKSIPHESLIRQWLTDPDEGVRQMALIFVGERGMASEQPHLDDALRVGNPTHQLFETYLETLKLLNPEFVMNFRARSETYAKSLLRNLPADYLEKFVQETSRPVNLRTLAIRMIEKPGEKGELLLGLLKTEKNVPFRMEVVRTLAGVPHENTAQQLLKMAQSKAEPEQLRAEALLALSRQPGDFSKEAIGLVQDKSADVALEAARYLRTYSSIPEVQKTLKVRMADLKSPAEEPLKEALAMVVANGKSTNRPNTLDQWQKVLNTGGNAERGRRVFYSLQSACSSCHAVGGRGGDLGPDLSNVGLSKSREQLIQAILKPSAEISPEWQGWYIQLKNGDYHQGRQIDVGDNAIEIYTQSDGFVSFPKKGIQDYGMNKSSLMPDGLESQLTVSDMKNLLAFLQSKKE